MSVLNHPQFRNHTQVLFWNDEAAGLKAIIAIHQLGERHALGGCRMYPYASDDQALADVLRLSRAMSYKSAMAGLPFGGGKCVIIGDPRTAKTPALLRSMGRFIEAVGGRFYTGEDVGIGIPEVEVMRTETTYLVGRLGADSSPAAGYGVFAGIKAAVRHRLQRSSLNGVRVAIQGVGQVSVILAEHLYKAGAELVVADVDEGRVADATQRFGAKAIGVAEIHRVETDVFAPCALGGSLNEITVRELRCTVVAGAANNQLATPDQAAELWSRESSTRRTT